jgi:hypothetical protein
VSARLRVFAAVLSVFVGLVSAAWLIAPRFGPGRGAAPKGGTVTRLPRLDGGGWLNGGPLTPDSLRGRVVALALWSDTDPGCLANLPAVEVWRQAYARYGVRVVGVHAPDFSFAADPAVPTRIVRRLGLGFPVALDPACRIRNALGDPGDGPLVVVAGPDGRILARGSGRAGIASADRALREALRRLRPELGFPAGPPLAPAVAAAPVRTVFLGTGRVAGGPLAGAETGREQPFTVQFRFQVEGAPWTPYPVGWWIPGAEGLTAARGGAANFVAMRYDAGRVGVVMSPPASGGARVWILRDEAWLAGDALGEDARLDARGASFVEVTEPRLYFVSRGGGEHVLKLSPEEPGLAIYAFTFESAAKTGR